MLTVGIGGALSALLVNDIVVFAMTPLLCAGLSARKLDPRPFLFALAAASNVGSTATLIGNPQNILIGQVGRVDLWSYAAIALHPDNCWTCHRIAQAWPLPGDQRWPRGPAMP